MRRMLYSLLVLGSVTVLNAAQQPNATATPRPDFSGTWTMAAGKDGHQPVNEGRANRPDGQLLVGVTVYTLVISHGADKLRIEEHRQKFASIPVNTLEYGLNGQPVKNQFLIEAIDNAPSEFTSKWQENKLVSTIDVFVPGESVPRRYTQTLSISPEGILAVRIQRVGTPDSQTMFYKKAK